MKKYYLQVTIDSNLDASTKAVQDCNKILHQKSGFFVIMASLNTTSFVRALL